MLSDTPSISALEDGEVIVVSNLTLQCTFPLVSNASDVHYEVRWYAGANLDEIYRNWVPDDNLNDRGEVGFGLLPPDRHSGKDIDQLVSDVACHPLYINHLTFIYNYALVK